MADYERKILNGSQAIVDQKGEMAQQFRVWAIAVENVQRYLVTGTPEGVLLAPFLSEAVDLTDPLIPVRYLKTQAEIGGDRTKGWAVG